MMNPVLQVVLPGMVASSYPIWMGSTLLENISVWMPKHQGSLVIITDHSVKKHYASRLKKALIKAGYHTDLWSFPAGERSKNRKIKAQIEEKMLAHGCDRDTLILAVGGGVVGDLAGFIAATYMRGIAYLQVPTTLLAMIDSAVGGKTGIDTPQGKNLIGAFWQPTAVISDIGCLKTLPQHHLINGLCEALKIFLIQDIEGLHHLERHLNAILMREEAALMVLIRRAVQLKADIVRRDARECGQRVVLNFGHTIGHALEQLTGYTLLHGYAVALGLLVEAKISQVMGLLAAQAYQDLKAFLLRLNISSQALKAFNIDDIIKVTQRDKKKRAGSVHYVLLTALGRVYEKNHQFAHPVSEAIVTQAFWETFKE